LATVPVILVIDDDPATCDFISDLLTIEGYVAESVPDGRTGLARVQQGNIDLVLLDFRLHDIDGPEFCRRVHAARRPTHPPIIMLSGTVGDQWEATSRAAGADDTVAKPFDIDGLLDRVRAHLPD
jgi:DNA-binding response OmpR family regulator